MARLGDINEYAGTSVNPMANPNQFYELYSVPSYETGAPEIISGGEIGSSKVTVEEGDVLICKINPRINRVWVVKHTTEYPLLASSEWIVVRNRNMNPSYLRWYFMSPNFRVLLTSQVTGIGGSLTRAQPKLVATYPVPIVEREEQDRVATILELVEGLIQKNSDRLKLLDDLVKSRFIELFRKYNANLVPLKSICIKGPQNGFYRKGAEINGTVPIMKMKQLFGNESMSDANDCDLVNLTSTELERFMLTPDDLLFGRRSLVVEGAGKCRRVGEITVQAIFESSMLRVTLDSTKVRPRYLQCWFDSEAGVNAIVAIRAVTTIAGIKGSDLANVMVPVAPLDEQDSFIGFVKQTDKSKFAIQQSLQELETLKKSLMQQYFG